MAAIQGAKVETIELKQKLKTRARYPSLKLKFIQKILYSASKEIISSTNFNAVKVDTRFLNRYLSIMLIASCQI